MRVTGNDKPVSYGSFCPVADSISYLPLLAKKYVLGYCNTFLSAASFDDTGILNVTLASNILFVLFPLTTVLSLVKVFSSTNSIPTLSYLDGNVYFIPSFILPIVPFANSKFTPIKSSASKLLGVSPL